MKKKSNHFIAVILISCIAILLNFCERFPPEIEESSVKSINSRETIAKSVITSLEEYSNFKNGEIISDRYIVTLTDNKISSYSSLNLKQIQDRKNEIQSNVASVISDLLVNTKNENIEVTALYSTIIGGFAAKLSEEQVKRLEQDPRVKSIKNDFVIRLDKKNHRSPNSGVNSLKKTTSTDQVIPWGVQRVGGPFDGTQSSRIAWIIDSGIDMDHPDLNVDQSLSTYFIGSSPEDCYNHGTHVAGIIGAKDNDFGVVGVASGATVVSVRAFNCDGVSLASICVDALQYVINNGSAGDVINCSWGWRYDNPRLNTNISYAVVYTAQLGFLLTVAAGNDDESVVNYRPAGNISHLNTFVLSAIDSTDNFASFSNWGNSVEFALPGVDVYSTGMGGDYITFDGTSMAAPHMAGMLIYYHNLSISYNDMFTITGYARNDPDGSADPIPSLFNTIVDNFNDQQIYDDQSGEWATQYPYIYGNYSASERNFHFGGSIGNPGNGILACNTPLNRSIGGLYASFDIKIVQTLQSDTWAAFHMFKDDYTDVPYDDGYWTPSGIFITFNKNGDIRLRHPYYTFGTASYSPGFSDWHHVEISYENSTFYVYVDEYLVMQTSYSPTLNGDYYGFFIEDANVYFDNLVVRETVNP
ncbi:MAG: S8 family serine peptidase [Ignavibacteria bacterium]|jgi:hypothetical protein